MAWTLAVLAAWSVAVGTLPLDPDYTAGEILDHVVSWRESGVLYPAIGDGASLRVLNYPPLVPLLIRTVAALGFEPLAAARIVNAGGLLLLLSAVWGWARGRGARGGVLAGTVGLLGASFGLVYGAGQAHVELWAVGLTVAGFAMLSRERATSGLRDTLLGGTLLALACFSKQSQVVPAIVALTWTWRAHPARARIATAAFGTVGVVGCALITLAWGAEPWRHIVVYTVGTYSAANLGFQWMSHVAPWALLMTWAAIVVARGRSAGSDAAGWYWGGAVVWALSSARVGSGYPYFLDLQIATALLVGPRIFGMVHPRRWSWLVALQVAGASAGAAAVAGAAYIQRRGQAVVIAEACRGLPAGAQLLTEEAGIARACGRAPVLHPFIMTSLSARGLWDPGPLASAIQAGRYPVAILPFDPATPPERLGVHAERWPASILGAFRSAKRVRPLSAGLWELTW